jgi:AraC-like DNA-binding protein
LEVRHNHVAGQHVSINYLHYGADVKINPGRLNDFYLLQVPLTGTALVHHRGKEIISNVQTATMLNPDRETEMQWHGNCRKLMLQIDKTFMHDVAKDILGTVTPGTIRFDPAVDLTTSSGQRLRYILEQVVRLAEKQALFSGASESRDLRIEAELTSTLLTHQSSNISHILHRADHHALPSDLRRALDFIYANIGEPIRLSDIAASAGLNVRTLQKGFQRLLSKTPMKVLHEARLDAAHYDLTVRREAPSVTDVAYQNGFSHLGRFSRDYKERFGQLPSDVL